MLSQHENGLVMISKFIFIPGMSRSGTTWLTGWLSQHGDVESFHEAYLIHRITKLFAKQQRTGEIVNLPVSHRHARELLDKTYTEHSDKSVIVDKSPGVLNVNGMHIVDFLHLLNSEALSIIMYRDGKNFVHGLLNLPWKPFKEFTVESATDLWVDRVQTILDYQPPQTICVKYEDLICDPGLTSNRIANFVGLQLPVIEPWTEPVNTMHERYDPTRWKRLSKDQLRYMERMNPYLESLGYEPI